MRRIRSCGFPCGTVRPSVGDLAGGRWLRAALAALSGAPFVLLAAGLWAGALAQEAPSAVTPGQIQDRFDDRTRLRGPAAPEIERPAVPAVPPPIKEKAFLLRGIEIVGSTVYAPSRFVPFYEGLLARQVTLADIEAVAGKITDLYEEDGYVLTQAEVPAQDMSLGVVSIRIVEGFIDEVLIEGQVEGPESLLRAYANKITADRPIRLATLDRYVPLIEDLPGVSVRPLLLEPVDEEAGAHRLIWAGAEVQLASSAVTPGRIEERFDDRKRRRRPAAPEIEKPAVPAVPPPIKEKVFLLTGIEIVGSTVYAPSRFVPFYEGLLARQVTPADIEAVAGKISDLYEEDGYVLTQAAVPAQDMSLGVVSIRIVEGFIDEVLIEGQVEGSESLLRAYASKITADRPTRLSNLERYVLLIEDLPGVSVRPLLEPLDEEAGEYKLILDLSHDALQGFVRVDNRGSRSVGAIQLWAGATFNSVLGLYETSQVRFVTTQQTKELLFFDFAHTEPVGTEGTTLTISGSYSQSEPGFDLKARDIHSKGTRLEIQGAHPVIRSRLLDVYVTGRFTFSDSEGTEQSVRDFDDSLRVVRLGATVSFDDAAEGRNWVSAEISQGLDILGASGSDSPSLSSPGASAGFTKVTLDYSRYQEVWNNVAVLLTATGQKSSGTVLSAEEIGLGGERFGGAYDPSEVTGKDGAAGRVELQYDGSLADSLLSQYQFYGYYDIGAVWADVPAGRQSLASAGFGVRGQFQNGLFGYVELAQPLTRLVEAERAGGDKPRFFFVLRWDL